MGEMTHTPGPWFASEDYYGGPSVRTVPEPNSKITGRDAIFENTGRGSGAPTQGDVALLALAPTAPHECAPECPGEMNRRRVAAFDELLKAARNLCVYNDELGSADHIRLTLDLKDVVGAIDFPSREN